MQSARTLLLLLEVCLVCLLVGAKEKPLDFRITTFEGKDLFCVFSDCCLLSTIKIVVFYVRKVLNSYAFYYKKWLLCHNVSHCSG